ncbi:unnamed protein product [Lymnaea stagnalis]|uniref:C-type lectin domain-containing protein n=1 Tax=Lymnaea stagnalis TaxID=6523 RepID=A0AAV2H5P3_LYMST
MCSMKYLLLLSVAVFAIAKADLLMEVKPPEINVGLTKTLSINCSFIRTDISNMVSLFSLVIMRSNSTDNMRFYFLASVDLSDGLNTISGDVSGLIDNRHESYITLTWKNPRSNLAGTYSCEANGQNLHGQAVSISKLADVKAIKPDVENLLDLLEQQSSILEHQSSLLALQSSTFERQSSKIDLQSTQLSKLQDEFAKLSASVNEKCSCCERFNNSLKSFYHISDAHNGSRYYLSPASSIIVMKEAERQCELLGGYLTEVESEDEYLFIKNFVKTFQGYDDIYLGGNDENSENTWVNTYSKTPVKYIKWGQHQPDQGRSSNCLSLWKYNDWTMADVKCYQGVAEMKVGYLCEVPE